MMMADYEGSLAPPTLSNLHTRDPQTSEEEEDSRNSTGAPRHGKRRLADTADGSSIELARKPRGRPPGSKNKPKPPIIITRDSENAMRPHVLEIPGGHDVIDTVAQFARRRQVGLCVINGTGTVANVTLRQPSTPGATVTFHGRYDILSLSATYLPANSSAPSGFTISLAGAQGQVVGGSVVGTLLAAGTVIIVAATFANPSFHRLPIEDEEEQRNQTPVSSGGGSGGGGAAHPQATTGGSDSCAMSIYNVTANPMSCHLPSDVLWAPTARPPY